MFERNKNCFWVPLNFCMKLNDIMIDMKQTKKSAKKMGLNWCLNPGPPARRPIAPTDCAIPPLRK